MGLNHFSFEVAPVCENLWGVFCIEKDICVFETDAQDLAIQLAKALNKLNA